MTEPSFRTIDAIGAPALSGSEHHRHFLFGQGLLDAESNVLNLIIFVGSAHVEGLIVDRFDRSLMHCLKSAA